MIIDREGTPPLSAEIRALINIADITIYWSQAEPGSFAVYKSGYALAYVLPTAAFEEWALAIQKILSKEE